jgi:anti-sigma factor RsiW
VLTCYRTRRRIGAYLDDALGDRASSKAFAHIAGCPRCHAELASLRRLEAMLREGSPSPSLPDWTGFWEGVRRGVEAPAVEHRIRPRRVRPRLVVGTAAALAVGASVIFWQIPRTPLSSQAVAAVTVNSADTQRPGGTVMIYSPPEKDLAVVWVFTEED